MTYYDEEDITDAQYRDYKYKEEGIKSYCKDDKSSFSEKKIKSIGYFLDIIIFLGFLVTTVFGALSIIKYGMPVGEDSFNILGLKNITEMTSSTINNITEATTDSIKQTFHIQSKALIINYSFDMDLPYHLNNGIHQKNKDDCYNVSCRRFYFCPIEGKNCTEYYEQYYKDLERCCEKPNEINNNNEIKIYSNEKETYGNEKETKNNESENGTNKKYTPVQCIKENSLTVVGSSAITVSAALHTTLISMFPSASFVINFIYATVVTNIFLLKVLPDVIKNFIDDEHWVLFLKIIFIIIDALLTLLCLLIQKKIRFTFYMIKKAVRFLKKNKGFRYGTSGGILLFIYNYLIIYILYGFISKFNHSDNPNDITYVRIAIFVSLLFLYKYFNYKIDYTFRSGISECIYYIFIKCMNSLDDYSYTDISSKGLEINKRLLKFGNTKFRDSVGTGAFLKTISLVIEVPLLCVKFFFCIPIAIKNLYIKIYHYFMEHKKNILFPFLLIFLIVFAIPFVIIYCIEGLIKLLGNFTNDDGEYVMIIAGMKNCSFKKAAKKKNAILDKKKKRFINYIKFITFFCFGFLKYSVLVASIYIVILFSNKVYHESFKSTYQGIFSSIFVLLFSANKVIFDYMIAIPIQVTIQALLFCAFVSNENGNSDEDSINFGNTLESIYDKYKEKATGDIMDYILDWFGEYAEDQL